MKKSMKAFAIVLLMIIMIIIGVVIYFYLNKNIDLKIIGEKEITLNINDEYKELGATAKVFSDDLSESIKIKGNVDTTKIGKYIVEYSVKSNYLKKESKAIRTVFVVDNEKPLLSLNGNEVVNISVGSEFKDDGVKAVDSYDGDITNNVEVIGNVDTNTIGTYVLTYVVKDSSNNEATISRTVNVKRIETATTLAKPSGTGKGIPIFMYHYFYDKNEESGTNLNSNYLEIHAFEEQLKYLSENNYYFPTWTEVADYVDGKITLPDKSVILTIDDGQSSFFNLAYPLIKKYQVPVTAFIITSKAGGTKFKTYNSEYVNYQSHTHEMHQGGCSGGHGGLFRCISYEKGMKDLKTSTDILGKNDVLAYPYGDVTSSALKIVRDSNFQVAVTTAPGKAKKGMDRLQLPRVRIYKGMTLSAYIKSL